MKIFQVSALVACFFVTGAPIGQVSAETVKFSSKEKQCEYLKDKKEAAEDAMKKGYTASQYDKLEAKRKHWKKLYIDQCF